MPSPTTTAGSCSVLSDYAIWFLMAGVMLFCVVVDMLESLARKWDAEARRARRQPR